MNWLYNIVGFLIISVLVVALIGPFFVDWTAYRQAFESQAEDLFGHRVKVLGSADARIFPVPSLTFTDVLIGDAEQPLMTVSRFEVDIELAPLIKGEVRVLDMRLDEPDLELTVAADGGLAWPAEDTTLRSPVDPESLSINSLTVQNGSISIADQSTGVSYQLDAVNFTLEARSLFGPYRIDGGAHYRDVPLGIQLGTGQYRPGDGLKVKLKVIPANIPFSVATDGVVGVEDGRLSYAGTLKAERVVEDEQAAAPVRATAAFRLDSTRFSAEDIDLTIGSEDRALRIEGDTRLRLGRQPEFSAELVAKQIDLDRILGEGPARPLGFGEAFDRLVGAMQYLPRPTMPGEVALSLPGIVVAGGLVEDVALKARTRARGWTIESVRANLPGRAGFAAEGTIGFKPEPNFAGRVVLQSAQPSSLIAWLDSASGKIGRLDPVEIDANLRAGGQAVELDTFSLAVGESTVSGSGSWKAATADKSGQVALTMAADSIDLDRYLDSPGMANLAARYFSPAIGLDSMIELTAETIRIGGVDIEGVDVDVAFTDGDLLVDRFFIENLAGAELDANGTVREVASSPDGTFELSLFATDVAGLTQVLGRLYPDNGLVAALRQRRSVLAPVALTGRLEAATEDGRTRATLAFNGDVGRTVVRNALSFSGGVADWTAGEFDLKINAKNEDGTMLLRQLGFDVLPIAAADDAVLAIAFTGVPRDGLEGEARLETGLAETGFKGRVVLGADNTVALSGSSMIETADLASSLLLVGKMVPIMAGRIPVSLQAAIAGSLERMTFDAFKGTFAGEPLAGTLVLDRAGTVPEFSGTLSLPAIDGRLLSETVFGADAWSAIDNSQPGTWPSVAFGPPLVEGFDLDIKVEAATLRWNETIAVSPARFDMRMKDGKLTLDRLSGGLLGGRVDAAFTLARAGGEAVVGGRARLSDAAIESFIWRREGRPVATGSLDLAFDFEGAGRSIASIVSSLTGGGTVSAENGILRSMNTGAFDAVIHAADAGQELDTEKIRAVFLSHLDLGSLAFDEISGSFTITSGVVRARNVAISTPSATAFGGASIDLGGWTVESDWSIKVDPGADAVAGAEPEVGLVYSGPISEPRRTLDTAPLLAFLTLRAFEQEVRRVEALQAEILERDRLLREMKQRRQEEAASAAAARAAEQDLRRRSAPEQGQSGLPSESRAPSPQRPKQRVENAGPQAEPRTESAFGDQIRESLKNALETTGSIEPGSAPAESGRGPLILTPPPPATIEPDRPSGR